MISARNRANCCLSPISVKGIVRYSGCSFQNPCWLIPGNSRNILFTPVWLTGGFRVNYINDCTLLLQGVCHLRSTLHCTVQTQARVWAIWHRGQRLTGQLQCDNFPLAILIAIPLTGSNLRGSPTIYSSLCFLIFRSFWADLSQTNFISSC